MNPWRSAQMFTRRERENLATGILSAMAMFRQPAHLLDYHGAHGLLAYHYGHDGGRQDECAG
jgi:hypothetical protein